MHPAGGTSGHARREQSGLGAAIIALVYDTDVRFALAEELADAFLDGPWRAEALAERGSGSLDRWPDWMEALAFSAVAFDRVAPVDRRAELVRFIEAFLRGRSAGPGGDRPPQILRHLRPRRRVLAHDWPVVGIPSVASLAERLELSDGQLAWLADVRGWERTVDREQLRNYRYRWLPRRSGLPRLIEAPKARLKEIQRWVLHEILDHVPPHDAAHGFTRGRSVLTHAGMHTGQSVVLRLDLRDFFASVSAGRAYGLFRAVGYGHSVAHALTGLCTNTIPTMIWDTAERPTQPWLIQPHFWLGRQLATPHLPQGAPTSPALANLAAFGLDRRLTGSERRLLDALLTLRRRPHVLRTPHDGPREPNADPTRCRHHQRRGLPPAPRQVEPSQRGATAARDRSCRQPDAQCTPGRLRPPQSVAPSPCDRRPRCRQPRERRPICGLTSADESPGSRRSILGAAKNCAASLTRSIGITGAKSRNSRTSAERGSHPAASPPSRAICGAAAARSNRLARRWLPEWRLGSSGLVRRRWDPGQKVIASRPQRCSASKCPRHHQRELFSPECVAV